MKTNQIHLQHYVLLFLSVSVLLLNGCKGRSASEENKTMDDTVVSKEALVKQVFKYPLPTSFDVTNLLVQAGAPYILTLCNLPENSEKYITQSQKALNLGIYGADLCYACTYNQSQETMNFLNASKKLIDDLNVSTSFNATMVQQVEANIHNKDTLIKIISDSFFDTYNYLMQNKQDKLSMYIMTGSWVESLYITTQIAITAKKKDNLISILVAHQNSLKKLLEIIEPVKSDADVAPLYTDLSNINGIYSTFASPKPTGAQISQLTTAAEQLRNKITK